jgi:protein kinase X
LSSGEAGGAAAASSEATTSNMRKYDEKAYFQAHDQVSNLGKLEQLEFLTTVGTGTFGRVIVVKHKKTKDYYALKIMSIAEVLRLKQTDHVKNEKEILLMVKHPFIINLYWTAHSDKFLYMLLEYVCGGELFSYLRNAVKFSNDTAVFFAAEIVSALEYLHSLSIIYRDLKPENLLLDREGHIRICDFGFAKKVHDR